MTYTLTTDNLLTLANIITTSGIDHHHPPSLGMSTSVQITMLYLQENLRQQTLAGIPSHYLQGYQQCAKCARCGATTPTTTQRPQTPTAIRARRHARAMLVVEKRQELVQREASYWEVLTIVGGASLKTW